jgi:hypothetical protein
MYWNILTPLVVFYYEHVNSIEDKRALPCFGLTIGSLRGESSYNPSLYETHTLSLFVE